MRSKTETTTSEYTIDDDLIGEIDRIRYYDSDGILEGESFVVRIYEDDDAESATVDTVEYRFDRLYASKSRESTDPRDFDYYNVIGASARWIARKYLDQSQREGMSEFPCFCRMDDSRSFRPSRLSQLLRSMADEIDAIDSESCPVLGKKRDKSI